MFSQADTVMAQMHLFATSRCSHWHILNAYLLSTGSTQPTIHHSIRWRQSGGGHLVPWSWTCHLSFELLGGHTARPTPDNLLPTTRIAPPRSILRCLSDIL